MIVMPSNNTNCYKLEVLYPSRIGQLFSPDGWRNPRNLRYALDNGRYAACTSGRSWKDKDFFSMLDKAAKQEVNPDWVVVPDFVGDANETFRMWDLWSKKVSVYGWNLALAVQDGMTPDSVNKNCNPNVIFVGGSTEWKLKTIPIWCSSFKRVHVGRVNTEKRLWYCHGLGVESVDGTGFFRGSKYQLNGLHRYLRRSSAGLGKSDQMILDFGN